MYNFKLLHHLEEVKSYWEKLSQNKYIYDNWEYQYTISKEFPFELYCYVVFKNEIPVWLLPFFLEPKEKYLFLCYPSGYMFHSLFSEKEAFYFILKQLAFPYKIKQIIFDENEDIAPDFVESWLESYYYTEISSWETMENFIKNTFASKNACSLRNQFRKIENISTIEGKREDIEIAIQYNIERFGEESIFYNDPYFIKSHKELSQWKNFWILTFTVNDFIAAVTYGVYTDTTFYLLISGAKNDIVPNIGKYAYMKTIEYAAWKWFHTLDAGFWDYNWKESWKFKKRKTCSFFWEIGNNLINKKI